MDTFPEKYNAPKLAEKERENLSNLVTVASKAKSLPTKETPGPDGFTREFYLAFQEQACLPSANTCREREEETAQLAL